MKKRSQRKYPVGEVISGTSNLGDLIPAFLTELDWNSPNSREVRQAMKVIEDSFTGKPLTTIRTCTHRGGGVHNTKRCQLCCPCDHCTMIRRVNYRTSDAAARDRDHLIELLNEKAGPFMRFGEVGYGDWAFYLPPSWEENLKDYGGIKVSDLSEVPKDFIGFAAVVNDHGNVSLHYFTHNGRRQHRREVWSVV